MRRRGLLRMGVLTPAHPGNFDVRNATRASPDLTTICWLDPLGLEVTGQLIEPGRVGARVPRPGGRPVVPTVRLRRRPLATTSPARWRMSGTGGAPQRRSSPPAASGAPGCGHVWRHDISKVGDHGPSSQSARCVGALVASVCHHLRVAQVAGDLGVSWTTASDAVLA